MQFNINDYIGFAGVLMLLIAFLLNLLDKISKDSLPYYFDKRYGYRSCLSWLWLIHYIPFIILEGAWTPVSLVALVNHLRKVRMWFFKNKLVEMKHKLLLKKRGVIESVTDILKTICDIEHTRHRSPVNMLVNTYAALVAYTWLERKPNIFTFRWYPELTLNPDFAIGLSCKT